jgi:hypothetical protein
MMKTLSESQVPCHGCQQFSIVRRLPERRHLAGTWNVSMHQKDTSAGILPAFVLRFSGGRLFEFRINADVPLAGKMPALQ